MIFILHYILFNAGLPAVLVLLTLFLQTYVEASLTEIGALLMALPFVSILIKPLFCALADRQQAHRAYLVGALVLMAIGYGSLAVAPLCFAHWAASHGRLLWYLDVAGIVLGFSAFGVVWSLGDALAVNAAQANGVSWGSYRVWAVVSWGGFGVLIGQINELPGLPRYVPAFFLLVGALLLEALLVAVWPARHFRMGAEQPTPVASGAAADSELGSAWAAGGSLGGTMGAAAARANPRLAGAVAHIFMEDLGGSLRSSLRLDGGGRRRAGLTEILGEQVPELAGRPAHWEPGRAVSASGAGSLRARWAQAGAERAGPGGPRASGTLTFGQLAAWGRSQLSLSRMNSLSAASGTAIADELRGSRGSCDSSFGDSQACASPARARHQRAPMYMSSLASGASLSHAAAARAALATRSLAADSSLADASFGSAAEPEPRPGGVSAAEPPGHYSANLAAVAAAGAPAEPKPAAPRQLNAEDLQLVLLKLVLRRDATIWKYLALFAVFGVLLTLHLSYFFLHLERLCRQHEADFSRVTGAMMAAHAISEVFSFTVLVPHLVPRIGRIGALVACAGAYAIRFAYYGTYLALASPYTAVPFELCHGIVYGIVYSLITDIAVECVDHVDFYLPELLARQLVPADADPNQLKLPLRATMQGVFSGAFDGLGAGIGALLGGLYLDAYSFSSLWRLCALVCVALALLYPLAEWLVGVRASAASRQADIKLHNQKSLGAGQLSPVTIK